MKTSPGFVKRSLGFQELVLQADTFHAAHLHSITPRAMEKAEESSDRRLKRENDYELMGRVDVPEWADALRSPGNSSSTGRQLCALVNLHPHPHTI